MKNFTNNFKQFTSRLSARWLIMALMLLLGTSSAWALNQSAVDLYFDDSEAMWSNNSKSPYVYIGHSTWTTCYGPMDRVSGTQYLFKLAKANFNNGGTWSDASGWVIANEKWWDGKVETIDKYVWHGDKNVTKKQTSAWVATKIYKTNGTTSVTSDGTTKTVYNLTSSDLKNYTVTINSPTGGTLTVKDYDNNTVSNGASKIGLTVLKFSASASTGYNFTEVQINDGSTTTRISAANIDQTYTVTSNVTITPVWTAKTYDIIYKDQGGANFSGTHASGHPTTHTYGTATTLDSPTKTGYTFGGWYGNSNCTGSAIATLGATAYTANITLYAKWEQSCITPDAPFEGIAQSETICKGSPYEFDSNYKWYTGSTGETTVSGSKEINSNTDYYIVNVAPEGCESARTKYTINVDEPLVAPTLIPTNPTTCNGNPTAGSIVIENYANYSNEISFALYKDENPTGIAYNNGFAISEEGSYKVVMTTSASNVCGQSVETDPIFIEIVDVTPTVKPFNISLSATVCEGNPFTMSYDGTEQNGDISSYEWYEGANNQVIGTESSLEIAQAKNTKYRLKITVTSNNCSADKEATITIEPKQRPAKPTFDSDEMSVCAGQQFNLPIPKNLPDGDDVYGLWTVGGYATTRSQTLDAAEDYKYTAYINNGCPSEGTDFIVHVNPLPEITGISVNNSTPVINEDVLLTVEGSDIARVEWSITSGNNASLSDASGNSVKLTSTTSGTVTVTATATSGAGCTATATKEVTFSETENCEDDIDYDNEHVEIWLSSSLNKTMYLHRWYENGNNDTNITTWPGASTTKSDGYYKWVTTSSGNIGYIFHDYTSSNKSSDANRTMEKGYRYYFTFNEGTGSATFNKSERISTTTPAPVTAPAVKTVSVNSEQGSGVVNFTGKIIKTGCAATSKIYYGYQFKKVDEEWPTSGIEASNTPEAGKLIPCTNASATALNYQFSANVEGLDDGDYHFRAYIINGYNFTNGNYDQGVYYGLDKLVTVSTVKAPVTKATIQLTESDGTPVANDKKYCVGETAYIMVESDVKYTEISWKSQQGVDIVQTRLMNMYQFVVKGNDNIVVLLSNKYNVTPAESNTIEVYTYDDPVLPTVSLNKVSICSNDAVGATVKLTNVAKGQTYQLYQQIDNGDDTFTENAIGSAKTQTEEVTDKTELVLHTLTNTAATGKYFVKTYTEQCTKNMASTQPFTFTVVDAAEVFISIDPASAETTPWMPAKFTVNASDKYTLNVTKGNPAEAATEAEVSQNGNKVSVKIPLPEGATYDGGQYENVEFPTTQYTITANLATTGGSDNPCAAPASATITLEPYVEPCTQPQQ